MPTDKAAVKTEPTDPDATLVAMLGVSMEPHAYVNASGEYDSRLQNAAYNKLAAESRKKGEKS